MLGCEIGEGVIGGEPVGVWVLGVLFRVPPTLGEESRSEKLRGFKSDGVGPDRITKEPEELEEELGSCVVDELCC